MTRWARLVPLQAAKLAAIANSVALTSNFRTNVPYSAPTSRTFQRSTWLVWSFRRFSDRMPPVEGASPVDGSLEDVVWEQVTPEDVARLESELDMIDEALAALQEGSYGYCKGCGEPIEDEVLSVDPLAKRCRACASSQGHPNHDSQQNDYPEEVFFSGAEI